MIGDATRKLMQQVHLSALESEEVMHSIMSGQASPTLVAAYLTALRLKGETAAEILGAARTMRSKVTRICHNQSSLLDNCGTGGDGAGTFNISTTASFVLAAGGVPIGKHGNRSISSRSGSADLLAALGANISLEPDQVAECIDQIGIGFMFAPLLHPAMKEVAPIRKELGFRTVFNLLGPLTNPAFATHQVIGVFDPFYTELIAEVADALGVEKVFVVHNESNIDELAPTGANQVSTIENGAVVTTTVRPEDVGLERCPVAALAGGSAEDNAGITRRILRAEHGPAFDTVVFNAGLGFLAFKKVPTLHAGVQMAIEMIESGLAKDKLAEFVEQTRRYERAA